MFSTGETGAGAVLVETRVMRGSGVTPAAKAAISAGGCGLFVGCLESIHPRSNTTSVAKMAILGLIMTTFGPRRGGVVTGERMDCGPWTVDFGLWTLDFPVLYSPLMPRVAFKDLPLRTNRFAALPRIVQRILFALFLLQLTLVGVRLWQPSALFGDVRWPDGLLVVLAAATTLASLARQLPGQSVLLAAVIIGVIAGAAHSLGALTGIPFGPYTYTEAIGQQLFEPLPWAVPMMWIVIILNSRGVARVILRPWRQGPNYGWWLIALTVLLVVLFDVGLEPFATTVKHYWKWQPTRIPVDWYGAPVVNFVGWALTALLIVFFVTPSLLNKKPVKFPPNYYPLFVWLLLTLMFLAGAAVHHLWPALVFIASECLVVTVFAAVGAMKRET
ncbi:MAG TPA: carotenoid biosynthesis protein [Candidatus Binatia bacterium]|jgi:uncharacterized membrane protein|nr:carotenoid biosynthesis protein [Candidatus Binatia bacterium]